MSPMNSFERPLRRAVCAKEGRGNTLKSFQCGVFSFQERGEAERNSLSFKIQSWRCIFGSAGSWQVAKFSDWSFQFSGALTEAWRHRGWAVLLKS